MIYCEVQHNFTLQQQSNIINMENHIPDTGKFSKKEVENIRELVKMAGGVKYIAGLCDVSTDSFHNPLRGLSSDFTAVDKMIVKAKSIIAKKVKQLA